MANILLVDDSSECKDIVSAVMRNEHRIEWASTLAEAATILESGREFDLVLLDIDLPDGNGIDFLSQVQHRFEAKGVPTIFVSGTNTVQNRIRGFSLGAVDYIPKPFDLVEFKVRVNTRLQQNPGRGIQGLLSKGTLHVDLVKQKVLDIRNGQRTNLDLTPVEFRMLCLFVQSDGDVVSRQEILDAVWSEGKDKISTRVVDHHICGLRKKIATVGHKIEAVYGVGYRLITETGTA